MIHQHRKKLLFLFQALPTCSISHWFNQKRGNDVNKRAKQPFFPLILTKTEGKVTIVHVEATGEPLGELGTEFTELSVLTTEQKPAKFDLHMNKARFSWGDFFPHCGKKPRRVEKASLCDCSNTVKSYQGWTTWGWRNHCGFSSIPRGVGETNAN